MVARSFNEEAVDLVSACDSCWTCLMCSYLRQQPLQRCCRAHWYSRPGNTKVFQVSCHQDPFCRPVAHQWTYIDAGCHWHGQCGAQVWQLSAIAEYGSRDHQIPEWGANKLQENTLCAVRSQCLSLMLETLSQTSFPTPAWAPNLAWVWGPS